MNQQIALSISLYESMSETPKVHELALFWDPSSDTLTNPPIQEHTLTEWAACGIALALVPLYTTYRVLEVAQMGERFDYWLGHDVRSVGLEISGTMEGDLATRTDVKRRQIQSNPYNSAGYICVVGFEKQEVRLSYYHKELE